MSRSAVATVARLLWMRINCSESRRLRSLMAVCSSRSVRTSRTVYQPMPAMVTSDTTRPTMRGRLGERVIPVLSAGCRVMTVRCRCRVPGAEVRRRLPGSPRLFDHARDGQRRQLLPRPRDDLHADGQTLGRRGDGHRHARILQQVEPRRIAPGIEVVDARALDRPLALAVTERGHRRDRAEQHRVTLHLPQHTRPQHVARDLDLQQAQGGERGIASRPVEELHQIGMDLGLTPRHQRLEQQPRGAAEDLPPQLARLLQTVGPERLHRDAGVFEPGHRLPDRAPRIRIHRHDPVVFEEAHAAICNPQSGNQPILRRHRVPIGIADVGACHDLEQQSHVVDRARHRPDDAGEGEGTAAWREVPGRGHAARRGLEAADAAEVRRHANRSAAVAADAAGRQARRDGRGLAAARSARRAIERPRAVGAAVQRVVGFPRHELLGDVGDAQDDGAGGAEACDQRARRRRRGRRRESASRSRREGLRRK